jgi:uncharacterized membrane protein
MIREVKIKKPIYKRWWFIAIFVFFAIPTIIGIIEAITKNSEAWDRGFDNNSQYQNARKVNCDTKKCYLQHLKDQKIKEQQEKAAAEKAGAEAQKTAETARAEAAAIVKAEQEAKADAADKLAASPAPPKAQAASTAKETGDPYYDMELPGYKERFCRAWAKANAACLSGSNYRSCVIARMSMEFNTSSPNFGSTGGYICNEDGSRKY